MEDNNNITEKKFQISFIICQLHNFKNDKIEKCELNVKVHYGDQLINDFPKIKIEEFFVNVNLVSNIEFPSNDAAFDDLLTKPLKISIFDVLPPAPSGKEKKQKVDKGEEKSVNLLAQCIIDLMPLITGNEHYKETITFSIPPGSPYEIESSGCPRPALEYETCKGKELVLDINGCNIMSITVESLFSNPESWATDGQGFNYVSSTAFPRTIERENILVFNGGKYLRPNIDEEIHNNLKKWPLTQNVMYFNDQLIANERFSEETGELRSSDEYEFRRDALQNQPRVTWNIQQRSYLDQNANKILKNRICENRYWPMQIFRMGHKDAKPIKGKASASNDDEVGFHGVTYIDMSPLLYPGVKRFRGAYKIHNYNEKDILLKTKKSGKSLAEESMKLLTGINLNNTPSTASKTPKKEEKIPAKTDKEKKVTKETIVDSTEEIVNEEGKQYDSSTSFVLVEIHLLNPLVERKEIGDLLKKVSELVPPREKFPKKKNNAEKAISDFDEQVCQISNQLFHEYVHKFQDDITTNIPKDEFYEQQRQELIYELNSSGKYLAFKERLKHSIIKIVREKYLKTQNFEDRNEFQKFLADLYVFLIDEMHVAIRQFISHEIEEKDIASPASDEQLRSFALEAEANSDYNLANRFYKERIARNKNEPDYWKDYGVHFLHLGHFEKSEECFKEALSINQSHLDSLILMGLVNALQGRSSCGEIFLETATNIHSDSITAWVIFGLFYCYVGNEVMCEMALDKAYRLNIASCAHQMQEQQSNQRNEGQKQQQPVIETEVTEKILQPIEPIKAPQEKTLISESVFWQPILYLLRNSVTSFAEIALASYLLDRAGGRSLDYLMSLARVHIHKKEFVEAEGYVNEAISMEILNANCWSLHGHLKVAQLDVDTAMASYERCLQLLPEPDDVHVVYIKLAAIYLQKMRFCEAKRIYIEACKKNPTCLSWLGVGISCYRLCELEDAEDALIEANTLDKMNSQVWAYLCLISLQQCRKVEAEQAYKYAVQLNLSDCCLLKEINDLQETRGFGNPEL